MFFVVMFPTPVEGEMFPLRLQIRSPTTLEICAMVSEPDPWEFPQSQPRGREGSEKLHGDLLEAISQTGSYCRHHGISEFDSKPLVARIKTSFVSLWSGTFCSSRYEDLSWVHRWRWPNDGL
jgi:hypothetical protein